jgi:hypothetical protein
MMALVVPATFCKRICGSPCGGGSDLALTVTGGLADCGRDLHAVPPGLPLNLEFTRTGLAADEGEAQEVEGRRLAKPAPLAAFRRQSVRVR